jgi:hypothetical protein
LKEGRTEALQLQILQKRRSLTSREKSRNLERRKNRSPPAPDSSKDQKGSTLKPKWQRL